MDARRAGAIIANINRYKNGPTRFVNSQIFELSLVLTAITLFEAQMDSSNLHQEGQSVERILLVQNQMGIHARPAAMIVRAANKYESDVFFEKDEEQVNGKSIMGLMMLAASKGSKIKAIAYGHDAKQALDDLETLFASKFDEK